MNDWTHIAWCVDDAADKLKAAYHIVSRFRSSLKWDDQVEDTRQYIVDAISDAEDALNQLDEKSGRA